MYVCTYVPTYVVHRISLSCKRRSHLNKTRHLSTMNLGRTIVAHIHRYICPLDPASGSDKGFAKWLPQTSFNLRLTLC